MDMNFNSMSNFAPSHNGNSRKCPICGEMFSPAAEHSYYIAENKRNLVCSWTCVRKWEKKQKAAFYGCSNQSRKRLEVRIIETGEMFDSITECARHLGVSHSYARKMLSHKYAYNGLHIERVIE